MFAEDEADLLLAAAADDSELELLVERRTAGEPLEQILGWVEFCGIRVRVRPSVFVPRQRSTLLVDAAVARMAGGAALVDLCCGSGAIGLAVAHRVPGLQVYAVDIDPVAVACARDNLAAVGGIVRRGDLYAALPESWRGRVDVVVASAPYVPARQIALMPPEAREHEPRHTLDGGADGLEVTRPVVQEAPRWLRPGGAVLVEIGREQADALVAAMTSAGLQPAILHDDERGATAGCGVLPG